MIDCKVGERLVITLGTDAATSPALRALAAAGPIEILITKAGSRSVRLAVSAPAVFLLQRTARRPAAKT